MDVPRAPLRKALYADDVWAAAAQQAPDVITLVLHARTLAIDDVSPNCLQQWNVAAEDLHRLRFDALIHPYYATQVAQQLFTVASSSIPAAGASADGSHADRAAVSADFFMVTNFRKYTAVSALARPVFLSSGSDGRFGLDGRVCALLVTIVALGLGAQLERGLSAARSPGPGTRVPSRISTDAESQGGFFRAHLSSTAFFQFVSPLSVDVLGYSPFELLRRRIHQIIDPSFLPTMQRQLKHAAQFPGEAVALIVPFIDK